MNCSVCYDLFMGPLERRFIGRCRSRLCRDLRGSVVEVGAGTGLNFPHYPAQCRVLAVEPEPGMRSRAQRRATSQITVRAGRAEEIPVPSHSLDHWVGTLVLCSVEDVSKVLAEARRVLKPEGRLHLLEHERGCGMWGQLHDLLTPTWSWLSGGCHLNRQPGLSVRAAGFELEGWESVGRIAGIDFRMATARPN